MNKLQMLLLPPKAAQGRLDRATSVFGCEREHGRSEEHTSELQSH